jgi:hypothetical protein
MRIQLSSNEPSRHNENLAGAGFNAPSCEEQMVQDINNPQYSLQSPSTFAGENLSIPTPNLYSENDMLPLDPSSIIPVVSEYFEWDLANLWSFDLTQHQ